MFFHKELLAVSLSSLRCPLFTIQIKINVSQNDLAFVTSSNVPESSNIKELWWLIIKYSLVLTFVLCVVVVVKAPRPCFFQSNTFQLTMPEKGIVLNAT